jgi:hypothetical protein
MLMRTRSHLQRTKTQPADRLTASIQPRSWGDSHQPKAQSDQPQPVHGFSHLDLFAHDPGPRSVLNIIQAKLTIDKLNGSNEQEVDRVGNEALQHPSHGITHHSHENSRPIIQRVRKLKHEKWNLPDQKHSEKYYRIINKAKKQYKYKNSSKRNLFVLRIASNDGNKRLNILLRSAGMGGVHPKGIGGRTAGHTEPQAAAILKNPRVRARIRKKLGDKWQVQSVFSSNQPCASKGGGTEKGCRHMETEALGNPTNFHTGTTADYKGGKGMTQGQTLKALKENDDMSDGSEDEFYDENEVRGSDLTEDDLNPTEL